MKVYILGAGPTGLALADGLVDSSDIPFTIIERGPSIGGLAQTLRWKDNGAHDLGPHKIFTLDQNLFSRVKALIPANQWLLRPKQSRIFMNGKYLPYPPSPFSLISAFGLWKFSWMIADYGLAKIKSLLGRSNPKTFEEDLTARVGRSLYELLFKPVALKLWGNPQGLDIKLSKGRVQTPSLAEVIAGVLKLKKHSQFEALEFIYPKGGLQSLWNSIHSKASGQGEFLLNTEVSKIVVSERRVVEIHNRNRTDGQESRITLGQDDMVFSSLPLGVLVSLMGDAIPADTANAIDKFIVLNDLLLVFLKIDKPELIKDSWVFVPDPEVAFHRISEQKSFDPGMTPGGSIVCCEIMSNDSRQMREKSDQELITLALDGIKRMNIADFRVLDSRVIRLPKSYPVFRPNFESELRAVLSELDRLGNFRTIGRQGAFNYIGTLDCMDIGYGAADWYLRKLSHEGQDWLAERTRTSFYPVLD